MFRKFNILFLVILLLAGCARPMSVQQFAPKDDDLFARRFIEVVRAGDDAAAEQMLAVPLRGEKATAGLHALHGLLAHGEPLSVELIGCHIYTDSSGGVTTKKVDLVYQIHFPGSWVAGSVYVDDSSAPLSVLASHFRPLPDSLEVLNRFTFSGKSLLHYGVFAACLAIPAFILFTLVVCIRSRVRRKWLWIVFILFGFCELHFDWTSGHSTIQPLSFESFGATAFKGSPYDSWIFTIAVPLGAILFLARRRRLIVLPARDAEPPQPTPSDELPPR